MGLSQIAANKNRKSENILPYVERYFLQVSERFRSRHVNRSANDIPVRVAAVDATVMQTALQNPEFRNSVVYSVIKIRGLPTDGCIMLQYGLLYRLYEVSLGGQADSVEVQPQVRALPNSTEKYAARVIEDLCEDMVSMWPGVRGVQLSSGEPSINQPNWGPQAKSMDVFTGTIDVGPLAGPYGLMSVALPVPLFERALGIRASKSPPPTADADLLEASYVNGLPVDLIAELQRIKLELNDIDGLQVGDFIPLHEKMEVDLRINNLLRFQGEFGEEAGLRAVRISNRTEDSE
jgi:flagellar motor switch protein FliM